MTGVVRPARLQHPTGWRRGVHPDTSAPSGSTGPGVALGVLDLHQQHQRRPFASAMD